MEYDDLLKISGRVGHFELLLVASLSLPSLFGAFVSMNIVFISGIPEHWCHVPDLTKFNLTQEQIRLVSIPLQGEPDSEYSSCQMYDRNYSSWTEADVAAALDEDPATIGQRLSTAKCHHGWIYDRSQYESTVVSQWDLVCGYQWMRATVASVYYAGMMVGLVIFGTLSDTIGRKPTFCLTTSVRGVISVGQAFSPNYATFVILRFFLGMFSVASYISGFVLITESVAPSWRVHAGATCYYAWSVGYMALAGVCYGLRDWVTLQIVTSVPCFITVAYMCFLPESARWLYTKNRPQKADRIMRKIAKFNHVELPEKLDVTVKIAPKGYLWDALRTPRMRFRSIDLFFIWFVNSLVYYGLSLNTSNLGGNDYLNFFIAGAVEIPAIGFSQFIMTCLGRRLSLSGTMVVGGAALFSILAIPSNMTWLVITLGMVGKFAITASFGVVYQITAEVYPTVIRNIGVSAGSFSSRVGGIVAPYVAELGTGNRVVPPLIFGTASIIAGLLALLLPETKGKHLPETLKDGEDFGKDQLAVCSSSSCFSSTRETNDAKMRDVTTSLVAGDEGGDVANGKVSQPMTQDTVTGV